MPQKRSKNKTSANTNLRKRLNPGKSNASTNPNRTAPGKEGGGFMRSKSKIKLLNLYNDKPNIDKMHEVKSEPSRIEPDRKWFGNVRTIDAKELDKYRAELALKSKDPYAFMLNKNKIDLAIFAQSGQYKNSKLTDIEKFEDTFGPKMKRIKPKMMTDSLEEYAQRAEQLTSAYNKDKDSNINEKKQEILNTPKYNIDRRIEAGQSKRIWEELYKVIDSSDVLCMVLDARDPEGTRCHHVEKHLENNCKFKHLVFVLNKTDLVPTSVTAKWVKYLSKSHPTIAFRADINKSFGREGLMNLLRQFDNFHKDLKTMSIGFIGYPNVGKSSVINSLMKKGVCKAAPIPGETKHWQYVALTKRMYMIDCPGVVYSSDNDSEIDIILKGVVRAERLEDADYYIEFLIKEVEKKTLMQAYGIDEFDGAEDFLTKVAFKLGRLLKFNEPDIKSVSKTVIFDWQRGQIPHYKLPPVEVNAEDEEKPEEEVKTDN